MSLIFYIFIFIFGLVIGSFLNVVILRFAKNESVVRRRSHCPCCQNDLSWFELVPVFSFLFLRGCCRHCRVKISWQYPLVELATGLLFVFAFWQSGSFVGLLNPFSFVFLMMQFFLISCFIIIFVADLRFMVVYDAVVYFATGGYFIFQLILNLLAPAYLTQFLINIALAILVGAGFFAVQYFVSKGKCLGSGDILIGLLMGVVLGFPKIILAIFLAYFGGAVISLFLLVWQKAQVHSKIPLAVFLIPATVVTYFYGDKIIFWYLNSLL
ncbi:MAG: prepilin peptidase [Patescibacteria group bacterium]